MTATTGARRAPRRTRMSQRMRLEHAEHAFMEILIQATGNKRTIAKVRKLMEEHPKLMDSRLYARWIHVNRDKIIKASWDRVHGRK